MKIFISKITIILISTLLLVLCFISYHQIKYSSLKPLGNWMTESNLQIISEGKSYDYCILGASNARVLSRNSNHQEVERILDKSIINLCLK